MCRPGVSRLHMFPSRLMSSPGPAARPRQCFSTSCKLELPLFSVSPMPPQVRTTGSTRLRPPRPSTAQKQRKKIMCIAEDATHCPPGHHQRPVPSQPEGYIRQ